MVALPDAGDVMPNGQEGQMYPGQVNIIVHPPIQTTGQDADQVGARVCDACPACTYSVAVCTLCCMSKECVP